MEEENLVKEFYTSKVRREWQRLVMDAYHRLEFDTTLHFLEQYLPARGIVLDAGGGPGRYTLALAQKGYDVVLTDLTPANLEFARRRIRRAGMQKKVREIVSGSITDLSHFAENTFDGVLCSGGPLSHILDGGARQKAIAELVRVAKPGAPILVSVMSRLSVLVFTLVNSPYELELPHYVLLRDTGDYLGGHGFTACHFFLPEELRAAFETAGVTVLQMAGVEGIASNHRKELNRVAKDEKRWQAWCETHFQTCTHPAAVGISEHILIVCRKN